MSYYFSYKFVTLNPYTALSCVVTFNQQQLLVLLQGIYTGSAYKERLTMLLPGATHCDASVSMIKIHMHHFHFSHIHKGMFLLP